MSYAHEDDKYGHVTRFYERLSHEVGVYIGEKFSIFRDREEILLGQSWKERIEESLDEVTFLIPIITPLFFGSPACCDELQRFLDREKKLGRNDLVLPIYYVDCPLLNDEEKRAGDELAQAIADHQYADWRELRFEPFTSPQVGRTLARLAVQIRDALDRVQASEKKEAPEPDAGVTRRLSEDVSVPLPPDIESMIESTEHIPRPTAKTEPPIRVVDPMHHGDHTTITEAIEAANPGDRILVRPGLYREGVVIEKPLEIIGDGDPGEVVVEAKGKDALLFKTTMGRVTNITLRQMSGGYWFGVDIAQGRLELEECDITSHGLACIAIHGGADPRLRRNRIHDGKQEGVYVWENGRGVLEDNDIFGNAGVGVLISDGSNPTLRRNRIHDCEDGGVFVYNNGQGILEDNDILSCVAISTGGNPTLRRNRIHDCEEDGVLIQEDGRGVLEDNDIFGNACAGVMIAHDSTPTLRRNRINKNGDVAVWAYAGGGGTIENNDLRDNAKGAWDIAPDSEPNLRRARNKE
uniref:TIR domain-containing protein n=1 Tax=Candidatus Methanogaster sp. ANME-2c ERB4 TaxID=2759911 RepID=A0A7G9YLL7_9EURY|nr:hypothetical protein MOGPJHGO_00003 [Methanosarcinales archaeon ANME-2c ERB4]